MLQPDPARPLTWRAMLLAAAVALPAMALLPATGHAATRHTARPAGAIAAPRAVPVAQIAASMTVPTQVFTLANGLTVAVHSDASATRIVVQTFYKVGAIDEPAGRSGFAHLYEHLMFNGSENAPGFFPDYMAQMGADFNGTTTSGYTAYYQIVPRAALDRALYLESDRMGHFLGTLTQAKLDKERGVVKNEKRQHDSEPLAQLEYLVPQTLYPAGHPYAHSVIGSMDDLNRASLADVKAWFAQHYGPNNAVLVISGNIAPDEARAAAERAFGAIPAGPKVVRPTASVPTLPARIERTVTDKVPAAEEHRYWAVPGDNSRDGLALVVASRALGLQTGTINQILVEREKLFRTVTVTVQRDALGASFVVAGKVAAGVDPAQAGRRLDAVLAQVLARGVSPAALRRVSNKIVTEQIFAMQQLSARGKMVGESLVWSHRPDLLLAHSRTMAAIDAPTANAALRHWLARPVLAVAVRQGQPPQPETDAPVAQDAAQGEAAAPAAPATTATATLPAVETPPPHPTRADAMPAIGAPVPPAYPRIEHARLANGMAVIYAPMTNVALTRLALSFDAGASSDPVGHEGLQQITAALLGQSTTRHDETALADELAGLGAIYSTDGTDDATRAQIVAPSANLHPAAALLAEIVRQPDFTPRALARNRAEALEMAEAAQAEGSPEALIATLTAQGTRYAHQRGGGTPATLAAITREDVLAYRQAWLRPDKARLIVVSDRPLAEILPVVNAALGDWQMAGPAGIKPPLGTPKPVPAAIHLIDRPGLPTAIIMGVAPTTLGAADDFTALSLANAALGGAGGRMNRNLREDKRWSYGAGADFQMRLGAVPYTIMANVQPDKAGPALAELRAELAAFVGPRPLTEQEFITERGNRLRMLGDGLDSGGQLLGRLADNALAGRPDDHDAGEAQRLMAVTFDQAREALGRAIDPNSVGWIVVGDGAQIRPQLAGLGLPVVIEQTTQP